jgi:NAD(P)H-hydrate epimerase
MSIMTGLDVEEIQRDRLNISKYYAKKWGHIVVLKGAYSVISAPDEQSTVIPIATPALARAGTGDVLAGIIVGLLAQGLPLYEAAVAGTWIHARSGVIAGDKLGTTASVIAGDVLHSINDVYEELKLL